MNMDVIETKLDIARQELLDLGLRNTLINYRPLKSKGVEVHDERPEILFHLLVSDGRALSFLPQPEEGVVSTRGDGAASPSLEPAAPEPESAAASEPITRPPGVDEETLRTLLIQPEEDEQGSPSRHTDDRLQTPYTSANLQKRLLNTFYTARTYIEEQGVNILYLALGMLNWYESPTHETPRRAPLILVPVELSRESVSTRFRIRYTQEEIGDNLSLQAKLKAEFGLALPTLEGEELDVPAYFDQVTEAIRPQPRWFVDRTAAALGFFSFGAFLMYNDLQPDVWPEEARPTAHPLIKALLHDHIHEPPSAISDDAHIDAYISPHESHQVVDADSSQLLAMLDVDQGRNLVIQGPPGTGKSQTITNIIAEAIGEGKTVLFVAEKMAALEVVKRRLDVVGLGDACLELHSHKANKKVFLDELRRTLELGQPKTKDSTQEMQLLKDIRDRLNAYSAAVNTPVGQSGVTAYQAFGALLRLEERLAGVRTPRLGSASMQSWTGIDARQRLTQIEELQTLLGRMGVPQKHVFWGSRYKAYLPADRRQVEEAAQGAQHAIRSLESSATHLAYHLKLPAPDRRAAVIYLSQAAQRALIAPPLDGVQHRSDNWYKQAGDIQASLEAGRRIAELHHQYDEWLIPEAWWQDVLPIRQALATYGRKWWRSLSLPYRRARQALAGLSRGELPADIDVQLGMVDAVLEVNRLQPMVAQQEPLLAQLFGPQWQGGASNWEHLLAINTWLSAMHRDMVTEVMPWTLLDYVAASPDRSQLRKLNIGVENALKRHAAAVEGVIRQLQLDEGVRFGVGEQERLVERPFAEQLELMETWQTEAGRLQEIVAYNHLADALLAAGLDDVVAVAATWPDAAHHLVDLVRRTWYEELVAQAMQSRPQLAAFDGKTHEYTIARFRQLDCHLFELNRARLAQTHWQRLPRHTADGQLGILQREFNKKRRHLPIRKLMEQAGHAIQTIKPVFMMSPLSIAMFLPPGSLRFDLVVFDEASQVKPVEAFGAILRGRQAVVVGDSRQLPPTTFFNRMVEGDEEVESPTADIESILSLLCAQGAPQRMLRWHYRSRHESLIALSNREFYDNKLIIFPSPDDSRADIGLIYHYLPDTIYERGSSRTNPMEASAVAEAIMEHASEHPNLTLGVVAFSIQQTQAILEQLELRRRLDPSRESFFNDHPEEPFFIKNLENVQGDERDVIIISIGYGRLKDGSVSLNFGPLNREGGERRLNVLITRARQRCEVFTNLTADDIDLRRTSTAGVVALKNYLHYARTGQLDRPGQNAEEPETAFAMVVADTLTQAGYRVAHQVGSAGFTIDLAIVDEAAEGRYLLGITCDGPAYHKARSARDRDRLRQQILEGLGWQIHHIWSPDWFQHPQRELQRLLEAIESVQAASGSPQPAAPAIPAAAPAAADRVVLERHEPEPAPGGYSIQPYRMARLSPPGIDLLEMAAHRLAREVQEVVNVEGPVHLEEVARRIVAASDMRRVSSRIKEALEEAVVYGIKTGRWERRSDFLWPRGMTQVAAIRDRAALPATSRKLELIPPEEIMLAIEQVIGRALGMRREAVPGAVAGLFGFGRTSEEMKRQIDAVIDRMLEEQRLLKRGDYLLAAELNR